jgi:uncharacterized membrane protein YciS (DUF1049 family)
LALLEKEKVMESVLLLVMFGLGMVLGWVLGSAPLKAKVKVLELEKARLARKG